MCYDLNTHYKATQNASDATGYSSLQCNVKKLTVQFLKYLCHIDMVYSAYPLLCALSLIY